MGDWKILFGREYDPSKPQYTKSVGTLYKRWAAKVEHGYFREWASVFVLLSFRLLNVQGA